jgi:hypothetical protein
MLEMDGCSKLIQVAQGKEISHTQVSMRAGPRGRAPDYSPTRFCVHQLNGNDTQSSRSNVGTRPYNQGAISGTWSVWPL